MVGPSILRDGSGLVVFAGVFLYVRLVVLRVLRLSPCKAGSWWCQPAGRRCVIRKSGLDRQ